MSYKDKVIELIINKLNLKSIEPIVCIYRQDNSIMAIYINNDTLDIEYFTLHKFSDEPKSVNDYSIYIDESYRTTRCFKYGEINMTNVLIFGRHVIETRIQHFILRDINELQEDFTNLNLNIINEL